MFITLEGMEGSGKSTLIQGVADRFRSQGYDVLITREPGDSSIGAKIRSMLLDVQSHPCVEAELFLFLADRAQHVSEVIRPALERDSVVISDRYADSTIVYQGYGRGLDMNTLFVQNDFAIKRLWPDITFILDVPPLVGLERACKRNNAEGLSKSEGRFEAEELAFHTRIRNGFLDWAKQNPQRCVVLDGLLRPDELVDCAWQAILSKIK